MPHGFIHADFQDVADRFDRYFRLPHDGGGAFAAYQDGELVMDIWAGYADHERRRPWERDTMAMSFSTTKGVVATALHRLVDRGLIDYDRTVASYWPAFEGGGRDEITVRQLMSHQAGLHRLRGLIDDAAELLDHEEVIDLVAAQEPSPAPGRASGYHGLTLGWLVAGLVRAITGTGLREVVAEEVDAPLDLDGCYIGCPTDQRGRVAKLFPRIPESIKAVGLGDRLQGLRFTKGFAEALLIDGFDELWFEEDQRILDTVMPAANGVFTARSLAKMYGALSNGGTIDGVRFLSPEVLHEAGRVQRRDRDYVLGLPMRWRIGYHQAMTLSRPAWKAFGHFGYGGSGAWADPETGLAVGFVTNRLGNATTPVGDIRLLRLGGLALSAGRDR